MVTNCKYAVMVNHDGFTIFCQRTHWMSDLFFFFSLTVPLIGESEGPAKPSSASAYDDFFVMYCGSNPEFFKQAFKFSMCFIGLQVSYLTWGYMQELIMTTPFNPTEHVPSGKFPSAAFCVFSNRFLAVIVALVAVRVRHGALFSNN